MKFLQAVLRVLFYIAVGGVISIAGAAFFFMHWEPDREKHPLRGIDVSHHQGEINWQQVAGDDVAFAYIKASEGGDFRDTAFETNYRGATGVGLPWGAYHFFSLCKTGAAQAANFLNALPGDLPMLAPVLDLEFKGNCARRPPQKDVVREIAHFVTLVEQATGQGVILYVPKPFYEVYMKGESVNRRIWARSIWRSPGYVKKWSLWQYHMRGKVAGINGDVDLNVLASDLPLSGLKK
ncbi:GH25 family lysozyme [uncultured Roseibium sp.]|uniref:GH25 family lysozyme n=1 Tax=uncultured Roseibium sp. TaxID=1936171 RepID=UPI003217DE53